MMDYWIKHWKLVKLLKLLDEAIKLSARKTELLTEMRKAVFREAHPDRRYEDYYKPKV